MHRRLAVLSLAIVAFAVPAFARVLSYAPYSNRTALAGYHERTTRHFVLIESLDDTNAWHAQQLVLYDTTGAKEPRVVFPASGGTTWINAVALYEPKGNPSAPPMLLASIYDNGHRLVFSADGGATWKVVAGSQEKWMGGVFGNDFGGPSTRGMTNPIHSGTDAVPFIVSYSVHGIDGITANGELQT
ncbi:MAG TPA: hypothetical protein VFV49_15720, partial [Thermoanaerobaculia bacterium]|nr:hypothetical protein [Thermoanaerobaculia bacterium]